MSRKKRNKVIHANAHNPYDKSERKNIFVKTQCFISFALLVVKV